jgi:aminoglycoside phosphotransferase (APT) family kinase protein
LEAAGLKHGDLKANNFVVHENEVALIDFDSLQSGDNTSDIKRFLRNWEHAPGMVSRWSQALADRGIQVG